MPLKRLTWRLAKCGLRPETSFWSQIQHSKSFWSLVIAFAFLNCFLLLRTGQYSPTMGTKQKSIMIEAARNRWQETASKAWNASSLKIDGFALADHVRKECRYIHMPLNITQWLLDIYVISSKNSIICPVEKVASTLWRRVIYLAENPSFKTKQPYQVSINSALGQKFKKLTSGNDSRIQESFNFFFVRDPYNRVLSAYIDKVFAPNPMFWGRMGKPSIDMFRNKGGNPQPRECFHDATFPEFVQFVIWSEKKQQMVDSHFQQASEKCQPCFANFSFIGKMESFHEDASYIFNRLGLEGAQRSLEGNMKELSERDAIEDSVNSPYDWRGAIERCMSWHEALKRVWRKLQIRGLIDIDIGYPLDPAMSRTTGTNKKEILKLALKAWKDSDPVKLKRQKKMVLSEMYGSLSAEILEDFRKTYTEDFLLFNYPDRPKVLSEEFERRNFTVI